MKDTDRPLTTTDKIAVVIMMIAIFALMWLTGCSDAENLRQSSNVTFSAVAKDGNCHNSIYLIALVDEDDAFEWSADFDCAGVDGITDTTGVGCVVC